MKESALERQLAYQIRLLKLPAPEREYRFAAMHTGGTGAGVRARLATAGLSDWRFDFAWPASRIAVEVEGGGWSKGRHTRGAGFAEDMRKYDAAIRLGWTLYRCDGALIRSGQAMRTLEQMLRAAECAG